MSQTFLICTLFFAAVAGILSGLYTGMSFADCIYETRKKRKRRKKKTKRKDPPKEKKHPPELRMKNRCVQEYPDDLGKRDFDGPLQDNQETEEDNVSHSFMGFVCESGEQDAVSKIRAARRSQDNKYMSRAKSRKRTENGPI